MSSCELHCTGQGLKDVNKVVVVEPATIHLTNGHKEVPNLRGRNRKGESYLWTKEPLRNRRSKPRYHKQRVQTNPLVNWSRDPKTP